MSTPKYHIGMKIETVMDAIAFVLAGAVFYIPGSKCTSEYNLSGYKTVPAAFLQNWSIRQLTVAVLRGTLYLAEKNTKEG